jgi:hypothetical protein
MNAIRLAITNADSHSRSTHILNESVDSKHDAVSGQAWLHGSFDCMIYRQLKDRPAD